MNSKFHKLKKVYFNLLGDLKLKNNTAPTCGSNLNYAGRSNDLDNFWIRFRDDSFKSSKLSQSKLEFISVFPVKKELVNTLIESVPAVTEEIEELENKLKKEVDANSEKYWERYNKEYGLGYTSDRKIIPKGTWSIAEDLFYEHLAKRYAEKKEVLFKFQIYHKTSGPMDGSIGTKNKFYFIPEETILKEVEELAKKKYKNRESKTITLAENKLELKKSQYFAIILDSVAALFPNKSKEPLLSKYKLTKSSIFFPEGTIDRRVFVQGIDDWTDLKNANLLSKYFPNVLL